TSVLDGRPYGAIRLRRGYREESLPVHRLHGVRHEIHKNLEQLIGIGPNRRSFQKPGLHMHFIEYRGPSRHLDGLLDHLTEVQVANCFKIAAASISVAIFD